MRIVATAPGRASDPVLAHEALDRTHLIATLFDEFIDDHRLIQSHPDLKSQAAAIGDALGDLYQSIGQLWAADLRPKRATRRTRRTGQKKAKKN